MTLPPTVLARLRELRDASIENPMDIEEMQRLAETPQGRDIALARIAARSMVIPGSRRFAIAFVVETVDPRSAVRRVILSIKRGHQSPPEEAVLMVLEELGFVGGLQNCKVWGEQLPNGRRAVNITQPLLQHAPAHA